MSSNHDTNLAVFLDFDNVAIGARDVRQRFDIGLVLGRLLEKGKIVVKKAYADWSYYQNYMVDLHASAIELIEVPAPRQSGKNSADIRMVVDAMDLCYSKEHIDVFVLVSGDSDFSPLVSKLRENNKEVIGVGMKGSSSKLLISNCDEFIFYDDLAQGLVDVEAAQLDDVPVDKKKLFNLLVATIEGLVREHKGPLYSSLVKDTMKRKKPDFNERSWGYSSFSDLLEDAMTYGLLTAERDERAGGTFVVTAAGGPPGPQPAGDGTRRAS
ncbi:NYN domain-containing protein, partial [bacterium]|nr:NYN domain-containing protein [bacterium]